MSKLSRLLNPSSIALYGGGWAENVAEQLLKSGYSGDIWPVNPSRTELAGLPCFRSTNDLPQAPDAAFVGVNRHSSISVIDELAKLGAGGAICFASGFSESSHQDGGDLQAQLLKAAGAMSVLGPNCYGLINYLDNISLWPDQHGGEVVASGAAIVAQSSNIAINMTMQRRGLPLSHMITVGNQAQIGLAAVCTELIADPRVTALGLYIEGFGDLAEFERMAWQAHTAGKPIVALKIGKSEKGQAATMTHTASLAGSAAASSAFLQRLGIIEVDSVSVFLETLKLLNAYGKQAGRRLVSVSCSGGEASLMADLGRNMTADFADFDLSTIQELQSILGAKVDIANPLDYHTYVWGDVPTMVACFSAVMQANFNLCVFVLDIPRDDRCEPQGHQCAIDAIIQAKAATNANVAVISLLPENLPEKVVDEFSTAGIVTLHGMQTGLQAISAIMGFSDEAEQDQRPVLIAPQLPDGELFQVDEATAKQRLKSVGLRVPHNMMYTQKELVQLGSLNMPVAVKALGIAHKTEQGAVQLGIHNESDLSSALERLPSTEQGYLVEEMVADVVAELLLGVTVDETGMVCMTLGAGGIFTEILADSITLTLPTSKQAVLEQLVTLNAFPLLNGYRGRKKANIESLLDAVLAVEKYVIQNLATLRELDINPLMVGENETAAVDALIVEQIN